MKIDFDYTSCIRNSERVTWTIDQVLPADRELDFTKSFLPDALAHARGLATLSGAEKLKLNQIRGHSYLQLFAFVEEYIIAHASEQATAEIHGDHEALRALLRFAEEEVKHQTTFKRYKAAFSRGFETRCDVLESAAEVAGVILSKAPLAVVLTTLHLELVTQQHFVECVKDNRKEDLEPSFVSLLKHHWMEEAQHAKIDMLELRKLAARASREKIATAIDDYFGLVGAFEQLLLRQAELDLESFERAVNRPLERGEADRILAVQRQSYRGAFLISGMTHRGLIEALRELDDGAVDEVARRAHALEAA
jgi:hypothetical protein